MPGPGKSSSVQILPINTILKNTDGFNQKHSCVQILPINTILKNYQHKQPESPLVQILPINTILKNQAVADAVGLKFKSYQ